MDTYICDERDQLILKSHPFGSSCMYINLINAFYLYL